MNSVYRRHEPGDAAPRVSGYLHRLLFHPARRNERSWFCAGQVALTISGFLLLGACQNPIAFPLDDAYITMHNAQSLLAARDRNYPGVPALFGATSLVHLALVATLALALKPVVASFVAGGVAVFLYTAGLARMAFQAGGSVGYAAVLTATGLCAGYASYQLLNGLETGLAMAGVTWALVFASERRCSARTPALCGLLPFIRPELAGLSALLLAMQAWRRWRSARQFQPIAIDAVLALCVAAPWLVWTYLSLGTILPPTAIAKSAFFAEAGLPALQKFWTVRAGLLQSGLCPLLVGALVCRPVSPLWLFVVAMLGALILAFPGGIAQNYSRYDFVLLPVLLVMLTQGASRRPFCAGVTLVVCAMAVTGLPKALAAYLGGADFVRVESAATAKWAAANIPEGSTVLIHDAGHIAFATRLHLVDLVGLKTPESVLYHKALTAPSGGRLRSEAVSRIADHFHADYAIVLDDKEHFWGVIADDLRRQGWNPLILRSSPDRNGYAIYRLDREARAAFLKRRSKKLL